jgi:predicted kinase
MTKLLMLRGLPAAGKSTFARELVDQGWARTNKDDIRAMVNNGKWSSNNEKEVLKLRNSLIRQYLDSGYNVVVDDTNFSVRHEQKLREIAKEYNAEFEVKEFNTQVWDCIERDSKRESPVGKKVIWQMFNDYIRNDEPKSHWICEKGKNKAIICDIDGTISHMKNRTPYDYTKVMHDYCDVVVKDIVEKYSKEGFDILFVSGREDSCKQETLDWLDNNNIEFSHLFMRKEGDKRPDHEIKLEIYKEFIEPYYSVFFCLDDRDQIVKMWRSIGLKCLQVEYGNF